MGLFSDKMEKENLFFSEEDNRRAKVLRANESEIGLLKHILYSTRLTSPHYLSGIGKIQAVFKIINNGAGFNRLDKLTNYIIRNLDYQKDMDKLDLQDEYGRVIEKPQDEIYKWSEEFNSKKLNKQQQIKLDIKNRLEDRRDELNHYSENRYLTDKENEELNQLNAQIKGDYYINKKGEKSSIKINSGNDFYHLLFSVGESGNNKRAMHQAMVDVIQTQFSTKGLQCYFAFHGDTNNEHFHVVLNSKSSITGKNVYFDKQDLFAIRQNFAQRLSFYGVDRGAILRKDNPVLISKILKQVESLNKSRDYYNSKLDKGSVDCVKYKKSTIRKVEFLLSAMKGDIKTKKDSKITRAELKEKRKELNVIKNQLLEATTSIEIEATVKELEKVEKSYNRKFLQIQKVKEDKENKKSLRAKRKQLDDLYSEHKKDIKEAIKYFKSIKNKDNKDMINRSIELLNNILKPKKVKEAIQR